jgi:hypothetical protein
MTMDEIREDIELVAVYITDNYDTKIYIEEIYFEVKENVIIDYDGWFYKDNIESQPHFKGYEILIDYRKDLKFNSKKEIEAFSILERELGIEISKKICIQTGYKIYNNFFHDVGQIKIIIYDSLLINPSSKLSSN